MPASVYRGVDLSVRACVVVFMLCAFLRVCRRIRCSMGSVHTWKWRLRGEEEVRRAEQRGTEVDSREDHGEVCDLRLLGKGPQSEAPWLQGPNQTWFSVCTDH